jgi:pyrimidine deaminase RibD-like protein
MPEARYFPIGALIPIGQVKIRVTETQGKPHCDDCAFNPAAPLSHLCELYPCTRIGRKDGKCVHFVIEQEVKNAEEKN